MSSLINIITGSVALGAIYALIALGFVFIYRSTAVVNFAHGEFLTLTAWLTLSIMGAVKVGAVAVILACACTGVVAMTGYHSLVRPVEKRGLFVAVIATMGIAFMLDGVMLVIWGTGSRSLSLFPTGHVTFATGAGLSTANIAVIILAVVLYIAIVIIDKRFIVGVQMRAAAADRLLASQMGLNVTWLFRGAWFVAGALAGVAGVAYAGTSLVSSNITMMGLAGLPAALIGGFDSVVGALPGGLLIGLTVTLTATYVSSAGSFAATYLLLLIFLLVRPQGLFGSARVERV